MIRIKTNREAVAMHTLEFAAEKDFTELTDTANRIFTGKQENGTFTYNQHFFQEIMPKLYRDPASAKEHLVIRDDGRITGLVGVVRNRLYACGQALHAAGIGTVGTDANFRGRGYMSEMMRAAVAYMKKENVDVAFLGGSRQRYEHFGFTAAGLCAVFELTKQNLKDSQGRQRAAQYGFYQMEGCGSGAERMLIGRLHKQKALYSERMTRKLADILHTWGNQVFLITRDAAPVGYLVGRDDGICELETEAGCSLCEILYDYMHAFDKNHLTVHGIGLYDTEKITALSRRAEDMALRNPCRALILNFTNVLSALLNVKSRDTKLCDGIMSVRVLSDGAAEQFRITVEDGKPAVHPCGGTPDLEINALDAAQLFCGLGSSFANLGYRLPACANDWFPLPLHIESVDMV